MGSLSLTSEQETCSELSSWSPVWHTPPPKPRQRLIPTTDSDTPDLDGGLGYSRLGYSGLGYAGLGYAGRGYYGLGYSRLGYYGKREAEAEPEAEADAEADPYY